VRFLDIEQLLSLLVESKNLQNASALFHAILRDDDKRPQFLSKAESGAMAEFIKRAPVIPLLSDYLENYYEHKAWFYRGLMLFSLTEKQNIFTKALKRLKDKVRERALDPNQFNALMAGLIENDDICRTLLLGFLAPPNDATRFYPYLTKAQILPAIIQVNRNPAWFQSPQYQLILQILGSDNERLFQDTEAQASEDCWQPAELRALVRFTTRHLERNPDCPIGQYLLAKLVFRCAAAGQTSLFDKAVQNLDEEAEAQALDENILRASLQRSTLDAFAARFYFFRVIKGIKEGFDDAIKTLRQWFQGRQPENPAQNNLIRTVENHGAMIDWKRLSEISWDHVEGTKLPILSAFLLNYDGDPLELKTFLDRIFQDKTLLNRNPALLSHMSTIMVHYPSCHVSQVIFNAFEDAAKEDPKILNAALFADMASFYAERPSEEEQSKQDKDEKLLSRFGQQKLYVLTRQCALFLVQPRSFWQSLLYFFVGEPKKDKVLKRAAKEAKVEESLREYTGRPWLFSAKQFFVRIWHGTYRDKNRSQIIKYCDDMEAYELDDPVISRVNSPFLSSQVNFEEASVPAPTVVAGPITPEPREEVQQAAEAIRTVARVMAPASLVNQGLNRLGKFASNGANNASFEIPQQLVAPEGSQGARR
jgi:hypothetical protein